MVAPGTVSITKYNGSQTTASGTSVSTALAAASYVNGNTFKSFTQYIDTLPKKTIKFVDSVVVNSNKTRTTVWEPTRVITSNLP